MDACVGNGSVLIVLQLKQIGFGASSSTEIHRPGAERHSSTPKISVVPPPSILKGSDSRKKSRGPSSGGPRPTARFISPHESESENTPISPNSHVVVQPPSPVVQEPKGKKTVVPSGKKRAVFVASSGRSKRPVPMKRQSSQSSTDSPAKGGDVFVSSSDQTPPLYLAKPQQKGKQPVRITSQENYTSSNRPEHTHVSSKIGSADIQEKPSRRPDMGRSESSHGNSQMDAEPGPSRSLRLIENIQPSEELTSEESDEVEIQRLLLAEANARVKKKIKDDIQATLPSTKNAGSIRKGSNGMLDPAGAGRLAQTRNKSAPSFAPTFVDANGQLELGDNSAVGKQDKGKGREPNDHTPKDNLFSKRPVQSIASTSVPESSGSMSRSKSQLTLLLEKDRAKNPESSSDKKGKRKQ